MWNPFFFFFSRASIKSFVSTPCSLSYFWPSYNNFYCSFQDNSNLVLIALFSSTFALSLSRYMRGLLSFWLGLQFVSIDMLLSYGHSSKSCPHPERMGNHSGTQSVINASEYSQTTISIGNLEKPSVVWLFFYGNCSQSEFSSGCELIQKCNSFHWLVFLSTLQTHLVIIYNLKISTILRYTKNSTSSSPKRSG